MSLRHWTFNRLYFIMSRMKNTSLENRQLKHEIALALTRAATFLLGVVLSFPVVLIILYAVISVRGNRLILPLDELSEKVDAIIVPGAQVIENRRPSRLLRDRLDCAVELYKAGISDRILVSGDHREDNYNEPLVMYRYLLEQGIPDEAIFMDHFGLDTYDTLIRARDVFQIKTAVVTTQRFHLQRALYISDKLRMNCKGYATVRRKSSHVFYLTLRELGARVKAILETKTNAPPTHHSPVHPINGDGRTTRSAF